MDDLKRLIDDLEPKVTAKVICLSDVEIEKVTWMWHGYIPNNKLVLLEGNPGLGKSTLTCWIAAQVSRGLAFPCGSLDAPKGVLFISVEDGVADTIKPRIEAAGGDCDKIHFLDGMELAGRVGITDLSLDSHRDAIKEAIAAHSIGLIIIDPLMALIGESKDSHKDQAVRAITTPLAKIAEELQVTVLAIRHLNKQGSNQAILRGAGSMGIIGSARQALLVGVDPQDDNKRVLAVVKSNLAKKADSLSFELISHPTIEAAIVQWNGVSNHNADDLVRPPSNDDRSALDEAKDFLSETLARGAQSQKAVIAEAKRLGISDATLRRAKEALNIPSKKVHNKETGEFGWNWELPKPTTPTQETFE